MVNWSLFKTCIFTPLRLCFREFELFTRYLCPKYSFWQKQQVLFTARERGELGELLMCVLMWFCRCVWACRHFLYVHFFVSVDILPCNTESRNVSWADGTCIRAQKKLIVNASMRHSRWTGICLFKPPLEQRLKRSDRAVRMMKLPK